MNRQKLTLWACAAVSILALQYAAASWLSAGNGLAEPRPCASQIDHRYSSCVTTDQESAAD